MNDLHLSREARNDLRDIKAYISIELENPQAALSVVGRITKTMRVLKDHAQIGTVLSVKENREYGYRYLVSGSYMIFYRVSGEDVYVDRVMYGRRDYLYALFGDISKAEPEQ